MKPIISGLLGMMFLPSGGGVMYYFLSAPQQTRNFTYFVVSIVLLCAGVTFLVLALRKPFAALSGIDSPVEIKPEDLKVGDGESIIEKNNRMSEEWTQTNEKRDKLKMLQIKTNEGESDIT
jgi:hypothetical protein